MNIHKNAKLMPASRAQLVERVLEEGEKVSSVASGMGISPATVYKWIKRFRREGEVGSGTGAHGLAGCLVGRQRRSCGESSGCGSGAGSRRGCPAARG